MPHDGGGSGGPSGVVGSAAIGAEGPSSPARTAAMLVLEGGEPKSPELQLSNSNSNSNSTLAGVLVASTSTSSSIGSSLGDEELAMLVLAEQHVRDDDDNDRNNDRNAKKNNDEAAAVMIELATIVDASDSSSQQPTPQPTPQSGDDDASSSSTACIPKLLDRLMNRGAYTRSVVVHATLFVCCALWGAWAVIGKATVSYISPMIFLTVRLQISMVLYFVIMACSERRLPSLPSWTFTWRVILLSIVGLLGGQLLFMNALHYTTASNVAVLQMLIPPVTTSIALPLGIERCLWQKIVGVAIAVVGAIVFLGLDNFSLTDGLIGNVLVVVSAFTSSFYLLFGRTLFSTYGSLQTTSWVFFFGTISSTTLSLFFLDEWRALPSTPPIAWLGVAFCVLVATVFCYLLWAWISSYTTPTLMTTYLVLQPLVGTLLAYLFLGESLGWLQLVGGTGILIGLALVIYGRSREIALDAADAHSKLDKLEHMLVNQHHDDVIELTTTTTTTVPSVTELDTIHDASLPTSRSSVEKQVVEPLLGASAEAEA